MHFHQLFRLKDDKILQEIAQKLGDRLTTSKKVALTADMNMILEQNLYVCGSRKSQNSHTYCAIRASYEKRLELVHKEIDDALNRSTSMIMNKVSVTLGYPFLW